MLKYRDNLLNTCELYHLWVIEAGREVEERLPLDKAGLNVLFVPDLTPYYLRKVRILNGAHTSMVHLSYLIGNNLVKESIDHPLVGKYIRKFLFNEVIPSINLPENELIDYANTIIERFSNPFIKHVLLNITLHSNSKLQYRIVPTLLEYYEKFGKIPQLLPLGFASFLFFMKINKRENGKFYQLRDKEFYQIKDKQEVIEYYTSQWKNVNPSEPKSVEQFVSTVLENKEFWQKDLNEVGNFKDLVTENLVTILTKGITYALKKALKTE